MNFVMKRLISFLCGMSVTAERVQAKLAREANRKGKEEERPNEKARLRDVLEFRRHVSFVDGGLPISGQGRLTASAYLII
jgi:hypothetical protein